MININGPADELPNPSQFAVLLGARARGRDCITRVVISAVGFQGGVSHPDDFGIGPVSFRTVPRSRLRRSLTALRCSSGALLWR